MTDDEEIALARNLPAGSRKAILAMSAVPTFPCRATFNANAAHNLRWTATKYGGLAAYILRDKRRAYWLTPLGERIRDRVAAAQADTRPAGGDAKLAPFTSGTVAEGHAPTPKSIGVTPNDQR